VLLFKFHPSNFTAWGEASSRAGSKGLTASAPAGRHHFRLLRLRAAAQLDGEIKDRGRTCPGRFI